MSIRGVMMEKIGFYGGCFNPPTLAHINLANKAIKKYKLNKLYFVPVGDKYQKSNLANANKRLEMLNISIKNNNKMEVLDIEIYQEKNLKANEVFKLIQNQFSNTKNFFIMGADNFVTIEKWENATELIQNFNYIVLEREGFDLKQHIKQSNILKKYNKNFNILKNEKSSISSTIVRNLIQQEKYEELEKYLDIEVIEYIINNNLYNGLFNKFSQNA